MASGWTLEQIIIKVRNITGTPSIDQLSNSQIMDYINNYYKYTMPFELKNQVQLEFYDFYTVPNQDTYSFSTDFLTNQPEAWADGFRIAYYENQSTFYNYWQQQYNTDSVGTGDGVTTAFSGTLLSTPIAQNTVFITDGDEQTQPDNGEGQFTYNGDVVLGSSIDYGTGVYNTTFDVAPADGAEIYIKYVSMAGQRPQGILFFNNEFVLRPIPDKVYLIRLAGFVNPDELLNDESSPTLIEWGQVIAYGAAMDIYADRGDTQALAETYPLLKRYEDVAISRYVQQYESQRALPRF